MGPAGIAGNVVSPSFSATEGASILCAHRRRATRREGAHMAKKAATRREVDTGEVADAMD